MSRPKVVVTGYEPWEHGTENPTLSIIEALGLRNHESFDLVTIRVPVDTTKIHDIVDRGLEEHRPDVWISLGLYPGLPVVGLERIAANVLDYPLPDNVGNQPHDQPVVEAGPDAYFTTLPIKAIQQALQEQGIPAKISNSASTYACNQIMYTALRLIDEKGMATRGGFIHVPCTPAYVAKQSYPFHEFPSMSLELMIDAVQHAIETTLATQEDVKAAPKGY